jgi:DNA polymerase III psi subunit
VSKVAGILPVITVEGIMLVVNADNLNAHLLIKSVMHLLQITIKLVDCIRFETVDHYNYITYLCSDSSKSARKGKS